MSHFARFSKVYAPSLKETPAEAEVVSHQLLLRAGMLRRLASGLYSYLPLAWRSLLKLEQIIREEMEAIDCQEISMPILQPGELWDESGRWSAYGPELMRISDRHDRQFCLGPTHEEVITALVRSELRSYKQLPCSLYQIQLKYRDERRPRFGLLRSREFMMKDAYTFHASEECLDATYQDFYKAYCRVCERLGLDYRPVQADNGQIGGSETIEFMALADAGENEIIYGENYAANAEVAKVCVELEECPCEEMGKIFTPHMASMQELADFLKLPLNATIKSIALMSANDDPYILFLPGDHDLNELKAERLLGPDYRMMTAEDMQEYGLCAGFIGIVGLDSRIKVYADESLKDLNYWICGANEIDYHVKGALKGRDFEEPQYADLLLAKAGDKHQQTGEVLKTARGIEVSQIFKLGTKYSEAMNATFADKDGQEQHFIMGCYGIGVSRSLAAVIEQHHDEYGIIWPMSIAPYELSIIPLSVGDEEVWPQALALAEQLAREGIDLIIDDRDERPGVKFADNDLMGFPFQLICGKKGLQNGEVELKNRASGEKQMLAVDEAVKLVKACIEEQRKLYR